MQEKVSDLIYAVRGLTEYLRDSRERDEELTDMIEDIEELLDEIGGTDD